MSKAHTKILALDDAPELREALYLSWGNQPRDVDIEEGSFSVDVSANFAGAVATANRGLYTAVMCPLVAAAPDVQGLFVGIHFEATLVSLNENYEGRVLYYGTHEAIAWARESDAYPTDREVITIDPAKPGALVRDAAEAVRRTVERAVLLWKDRSEAKKPARQS